MNRVTPATLNMTPLIAMGLMLSLSACTPFGSSEPGPSTALSEASKIEQNVSSATSTRSLTLTQLPLAQLKDSGRLLMSTPLGIHWIGTHLPSQEMMTDDSKSEGGGESTASILVHGYRSRGYEWIEALQERGAVEPTAFYRWDTAQCPKSASEALLKTLSALSAEDPTRHLKVFGHSYGGLITAIAATRYQGRAPLTAHVIAAPLAGSETLESRCEVKVRQLLPTPIKASQLSPQLTLYQWRTQHRLDGAFRRTPVDPQVVEIPGRVTRLPERFRGHRLGHNRSISWVIERLKTSKEHRPKRPTSP